MKPCTAPTERTKRHTVKQPSKKTGQRDNMTQHIKHPGQFDELLSKGAPYQGLAVGKPLYNPFLRQHPPPPPAPGSPLRLERGFS